MFSSEDIEIETFMGTVGFMSISSYAPSSGTGGYGEDLELREVQQLGEQTLDEGDVQCRLYTGRVARGQLAGTRVMLKAYPSSRSSNADVLAANELTAHASLQPPSCPVRSEYLVELLGGFQSKLGPIGGQQWLVFTAAGRSTAAQYAAEAAKATAEGGAVGGGEFWDRFDRQRPLLRRQMFILTILRQVMLGLSFMHSHRRLHQSLGPNSVLLSGTNELDLRFTRARLMDLAFSVDVSDEALFGGATLGQLWDRMPPQGISNPLKEVADGLWRRGWREGAQRETEKRNYGFSDDVYAAGLLLAYMAFVPLCPPGTIDGPYLQRLLESTFRLDIEAVREYADADERWSEAVAFLDRGGGAGWDLLKAMLNPDWRLRPTAASCLLHPFLKGTSLAAPPAAADNTQQGSS